MLLVREKPGSSLREQELLKSQVRSELARRSHRERKRKSVHAKTLPPLPIVDPSPKNVVTGTTSSDPFDCMPVTLTNLNVWLMRQYFNIGRPGGCGERKCPSCRYATEQTYDALHTYALLASSAARYREVERAILDEKTLPEYYNAKALSLLRERMSRFRSTDEKWQIMLDVLRLYVCEWYLRREEAARVHLAFFGHVWNSLDIDNSTFDLHVHNVISLNDIILAAHMDRPPAVHLHPAADHIPAVVRDRYRPDPASNRGSGLLHVCEKTDFNVTLRSIVVDLVDFSNFAETDFSTVDGIERDPLKSRTICPLCVASAVSQNEDNGSINESNHCQRRRFYTYDVVGYSPLSRLIPINLSLPGQSRRRVRVKLIACLHRLLCCSELSDPIEQAVRWTLFICTALVAALHPRKPGKYDMSILAQRLRNSLSRHRRPLGDPFDTAVGNHKHTKMWFWMCMTGVRASNRDTENYDWFLEEAIDCARALELDTVEQVEATLSEYFFCQCAHAEAVQVLAEELDLEMPVKRPVIIFDRIAIVGDRQRKQFCVHDF